MGQNEEKKTVTPSRRVRFNLIDLVLIIAVLACLTGVYLRYNVSEQFGVNHELSTFVLSFEIKNIRYTSADAFPEGDSFYLNKQDKLLGTVLAIDSTSPTEVVYTDDKGNYKTAYYPEDTRIDLTGRLQATGIMTDSGFLLDGNTFLAPGQTYAVQTPRIDVSVTITAIEETETVS